MRREKKMEVIDLQGEIREKIGGCSAGRLRKEGIVPGVVYGQMKAPIHIQVARAALEQALHTSAGENVVLNLKLGNKQTGDVTVIMKDVQHHIVNDRIEHIDFQEISLTEKIKVYVHLHTKGESPGIQQGGILDLVHHEIELECLPTAIPEKITVDISNLSIGDALHIKDITFPEGVECFDDPEEVIVVVHPPEAEKEETEGEALESEDQASEPEVIKKGKDEKEEA
jgi:large subunit ribosomal protein L25